MNRRHLRALTLSITMGLVLAGCSVTVGSDPGDGPTPDPAAPVASPTDRPGATGTASPTGPAGAALPGFEPGQFPAVPLFDVPDVSVLETKGKALRDKLTPELKDLPGITVRAVQCAPDGSYVNPAAGLVLYGDGSGTYTGPDGSYTRGADGSETSVTEKESITRDGKGGGTYVSHDVSITNAGDGSGTFISEAVSITLDGKGGGTYVSEEESISNAGDGSGTYVSDAMTITNAGDGSGTYVDRDFSVSNDGKGQAQVITRDTTVTVAADPLPPVPPLGKFPPVEQLAPRSGACGFVITLADGVLFDFNRDVIRPEANAPLDQLGRVLAQVGGQEVQVSGHTDSIGSDAYNQDLSERRAQAVVAALQQRGVSAPMVARGYGESRPVAPNELKGKDNPAGRQLNRRVEIFVRV